MHDYGGFEKVGDLPWDLPTNDEEIEETFGGKNDITAEFFLEWTE